MSTWPTHPNGENKTVGEMTADERKSVMAAAKKRFLAPVPNTHRDDNAAYRRDMIDAGRGHLLR
jgi:hypothetical protein